MKKLRRLTEAEVISEFLRGEFFHKEYDADREQFAELVHHPDLTNEFENSLRRALFFRRRNTMWWELPEDRQWWELEFEPADVEQVSIFPRAHWRKLAGGNFKALHVAERVRRSLSQNPEDIFAHKINAICAHMRMDVAKGLIVFLGLDEHHPVTLIEGNHRFISSLVAGGPETLRGARMVGVFSPNMEKCCWYKTNPQTLFRCLKNRIQHYWDRDPDTAQLLKSAFRGVSPGCTENAGPVKSK